MFILLIYFEKLILCFSICDFRCSKWSNFSSLNWVQKHFNLFLNYGMSLIKLVNNLSLPSNLTFNAFTWVVISTKKQNQNPTPGLVTGIFILAIHPSLPRIHQHALSTVKTLQNFSSSPSSHITVKYQFSILFLQYFTILCDFSMKQSTWYKSVHIFHYCIRNTSEI
jgi:hypothetical protein